jgi:hypothetical protein
MARAGASILAPRSASQTLPLCLFYGNCQAVALRLLAGRSASFSGAYRSVAIPAVHELSATQVPQIHRLVREASVIVHQPVRNGIYGMPLGSEEIFADAPADCRRITFGSLVDCSLYPFEAHATDLERRRIVAPLTISHDLRHIYCAAIGMDYEQALQWVEAFEPDPAAIREVGARVRAKYLAREERVEIRVLGRLTSHEVVGGMFHSMYHPANRALLVLLAEIQRALGLAVEEPVPADQELLAFERTPIERSVIDALGVEAEPREHWETGGRHFSRRLVLGAHLSWYREEPAILERALARSADQLTLFGLAV